jgi:hypothetical protein
LRRRIRHQAGKFLAAEPAKQIARGTRLFEQKPRAREWRGLFASQLKGNCGLLCARVE